MKQLYLLLLLSNTAIVTFAQPIIGFTKIISGLTIPVDIANAGDGTNRLFIVQQNGLIKIDSAGTLLSKPFLDVSSAIVYNGAEQGLLSLAFHPDYASNRYFFIYYTDPSGSVTIAQYRTSSTNPDSADAASGKVLMSITKKYNNHNGGKLNFGPDGDLYFGTGDGGSEGDPDNNSQNGQSLLGKLIRINVDNFTTPPYFTVPPTNPFVGSTTIYDSIYSLGLRNPWRWSFDKLTGDMWLADVGQNMWEEVNYQTPSNMSGLNYGWRCYEADHPYNLTQCGSNPSAGKTFPIFEYDHVPDSGNVIIGGYVYRGTEFPALQGYYICCDEQTPNGFLINPDGSGGWNVREQTDFPANVTSFGEAEDGSLYVLSAANNALYKITVTSVVPVKLLSFQASGQNGKDVLQWKTADDNALEKFEIQQSPNGTEFYTIENVAPVSDSKNYTYSYTNPNTVTGIRYYRLKLDYTGGYSDYSSIVKLDDSFNRIIITQTNTKQFVINTPYSLHAINVINESGQTIARYTGIPAGPQTINLSRFPSGIYLLECISDKIEQFKILN